MLETWTTLNVDRLSHLQHVGDALVVNLVYALNLGLGLLVVCLEYLPVPQEARLELLDFVFLGFKLKRCVMCIQYRV